VHPCVGRIEAHAFRRIQFDDVYEMVNRPFLPLYSYTPSRYSFRAVFIYSIALRGIQAKFVEVAREILEAAAPIEPLGSRRLWLGLEICHADISA
jgi:hypothetical protein